MNFLLSMLPIYFFGNIHCLGMCGPLVMMLGKHRFRYYYFIGRTLSFSLAGLITGTLGGVLTLLFKDYYIPAFVSFLFGFMILILAFDYFYGIHSHFAKVIAAKLAPLNKKLSLLMLQDNPLSTFLFGFATIFLPCGQTMLVYSACAIYCNPWTGLLNGFLFAFITSPSLYFSLHAMNYFGFAKKYYQKVMGAISLMIGILAICRGLAEIDFIPHLVINLGSSEKFHFVLY